MKFSSMGLLLGPGILLAATGVGAGDLATAAFAGSRLGLAVLWAVILGAFLKYVLNEGLARWQLVTGQGFFDGVASRLGRFWLWLFLPYLLLWSYFVGLALISACGVAAQALIPVSADPLAGKRVWAVVHAVLGLLLVWFGGFRLFEWAMRACIAVMFLVVVATAVRLWPGSSAVVSGLLPKIPQQPEALGWTLALIGGVGGTLTVLCYGYWMAEVGRKGPEALAWCRIDLALAYSMTAIFGMAMLIIGSSVEISGGGARLLVELGHALQQSLGEGARIAFLIGAWGAIFSSLLGVWQAVPYLFADLSRVLISGYQNKQSAGISLESSRAYRGYLIAIAFIPMIGLGVSFVQAQKLYAISGALFIPMLALALLLMNGRKACLGEYANRWPSGLALSGALGFFAYLAFR